MPTSSFADGWAFKNNVNIRTHRNLQDRLQAARLLLDRSPQCPVVVDTMEDQSSHRYAALPERLYVLQEGRILYKVTGDPGPRKGTGRKGFVAGRATFTLLPAHLPAVWPAASPLLTGLCV